MSIRELPDFLKQGDKALGMPRREGFRHIIGTAQPDSPPVGPAVINSAHPELVEGDPQCASGQAAREWLAHVAAGRIGGS